MVRILLGSPVRQTPSVLAEFLQSVQDLDLGSNRLDTIFTDDCDDPVSSRLLREFRSPGTVTILPGGDRAVPYVSSNYTHQWTPALYDRVAAFRDSFMDRARLDGYDYVFLCDSDLVLHPATLRHLLASNVDICAEIHWTKWKPEEPELPNVWMGDQYRLYRQDRYEELDQATIFRRYNEFLSQLRIPGVYEVGGLCACVLISRWAINRGVSYGVIPNLTAIGEDRDFCYRATALGLKLHVDTRCPSLHLYRESDLDRVASFRAANPPEPIAFTQVLDWQEVRTQDSTSFEENILAEQRPDRRAFFPPKLVQRRSTGNLLTLSMVVRNEADRFLHRILEQARTYVDAAVIIDDASTDDTVAICRELLDGIPLRIVTLPQSRFENEHELRRLQWHETLRSDPDWILNLDADEVFGDDPRDDLPLLLNQTEYDVYGFQMFDMWDEGHYRADSLWRGHEWYAPLLVRPTAAISDRWKETSQHCGRWPLDVYEILRITSRLRVQHLGWSDENDRVRKQRRYFELDGDADAIQRARYESILDPSPALVEWQPAPWLQRT